MNDKGRRQSAPATSNITGLNHTFRARRRPELLIAVPLEGWPRVSWHTESVEDEQRLRLWLQRSPGLTELHHYLAGLIDFLDDEAPRERGAT